MLVYQIIDNATKEVYIGSTTSTLAARLEGHQKSCGLYAQGLIPKKPSAAFDIFQRGDFTASELETVPGDKNDLLRRERYHTLNRPCVNLYLPGTRAKLSDVKGRWREPRFVGDAFITN